jgi:hypothetical protein
MSEPLRILILGSAIQGNDGGFNKALVDALRRAGIVIEEANFDTDESELLDRLESTTLSIVLKPC